MMRGSKRNGERRNSRFMERPCSSKYCASGSPGTWEAKRLQAPAVVGELGREDVAVAGEGQIVVAVVLEPLLAVDLLVEQAEAVAPPQVVVEVDLAAQHLGEGHGQHHALVLGAEGGDERVVPRVDTRFQHLLDTRLTVGHERGFESGLAPVEPQERVVVDVVLELAERSVVEAEHQVIRIVHPQATRIEDLPDRLDERVRNAVEIVAGEQRRQRGSRRHPSGNRPRQRRQEDVPGAFGRLRPDAFGRSGAVARYGFSRRGRPHGAARGRKHR